MSFGIKTWDPVHVKVDEKTGSPFSNPIRFTASNSTYYPFILAIDFIQFENLSPRPAAREMEVFHGTSNLFSFSAQVSGNSYGFRYTSSYWLAPSEEVINNEFPYLIPLKEGKVVFSKKFSSIRLSDSFTGARGDTVYCMRKGLVTAVPGSETPYFRLSSNDCLEVLHNDGTYMIYHYLNKNDAFKSPGSTVLPGQPIGRLSDSAYVLVNLMRVENLQNLMIPHPIKYTTGKTETYVFDAIDGKEKSVFPLEVITKEMNKKELKKTKIKY